MLLKICFIAGAAPIHQQLTRQMAICPIVVQTDFEPRAWQRHSLFGPTDLTYF